MGISCVVPAHLAHAKDPSLRETMSFIQAKFDGCGQVEMSVAKKHIFITTKINWSNGKMTVIEDEVIVQ
jgi:hypothetical protein